MEESNLEERQIVEIDNIKYTVISRKAKDRQEFKRSF